MKDIITRHKAGEALGICSVCSAHPLVIEAALRFDLHTDNKVLIEATSNQVNQFGGYTGMKPADFRDFVLKIAKEGANKRGNSSRLTQPFHFFMFEPIFSPVNALNQPI